MTEPTPAGALACPFVAFEDDRDARADAPDHRHRCYAEVRPAPRAIAHQEAFCLSPGFAACPTFQDWARREAARAKPAVSSDRNELAGLARPGREPERPIAAESTDDDEGYGDPDDGSGLEPAGDPRSADLPPGRTKSRDWAAPPAWVADSGEEPDQGEAPAFLSDVGASASVGLAGSRWLNEARSSAPGDPELADLDRSVEADRAARQARETRDVPAARRAPASNADDDDDLEPIRPVASAVASPGRRANQVSRRPAPTGREPGRPAWERSRRNEAYPTLKTRIGMPAIPRAVLALGALVIAAVVMISLPFLLNLGGAPGVPTPSVSATPAGSGLPSAGPTGSSVTGLPTPQTYKVVSGDTITKIAKHYGVTTAALLAANPQIKNANNIKPGDILTIPSPTPSNGINGASPGAS